jgi:hypothetical protein
MPTNPLLDIACHRVLTTFSEGPGAVLRGAVFNKVITLVNSRLLETQFDINLPRCWYLWGEEVVPSELPPAVRFSPRESPVELTTFRWTGGAPDESNLPEWKCRKIGHVVEGIRSEFGPSPDLPELVDEVYSNAPFAFQREFLSLRRRFFDFGNENSGLWRVSRPITNILRPTFEAAMREYPDPEFPSIHKLTHRYRRIFEFGLQENRIVIPTLARMSETYWQSFCYALRVHPRGHANVSQNKLEFWDRTRIEDLQSVNTKLTADAQELVDRIGSGLDAWDRARIVGAHWGPHTSQLSSEVDAIAYR